MNNIVQSLREMLPDTPWDHDNGVIAEAADEIERLQAKVALFKHEVGCYWCTNYLPGGFPCRLCPECQRLQEALKAAETEGGE